MRNLLWFTLILLAACGDGTNDASDVFTSPETTSRTTASYAKGFAFVQLNGVDCIELYDLESDSLDVRCTLCKGDPQRAVNNLISLPDSGWSALATLSTTHLAYFWKLNALDAVAGTAYADWVRNEEVKARLADGRIADLSGEKEIDFEMTVAKAPDALIVYPYGGTDYSRFEQVNIAIVPFAEYLETHPLGRAEWIKVVGFLTGFEAKASDAFAAIEQGYREANLQAAYRSNRPTVFTGSHDNGMWYAPPGNSFIAQFIRDAGGNYLFDEVKQRGNLEMDFEVLLTRAQQADYWGKVVFEEGQLTLDDLRADDERYAALPAFENGNVFYCNAAETDYFGDAIVEPEAILRDLIAILHPEILPEHRYRYFQPIAP
jgi:iron complex transport system substrate-binding protein